MAPLGGQAMRRTASPGDSPQFRPLQRGGERLRTLSSGVRPQVLRLAVK